jgi:hypothetical protein
MSKQLEAEATALLFEDAFDLLSGWERERLLKTWGAAPHSTRGGLVATAVAKLRAERETQKDASTAAAEAHAETLRADLAGLLPGLTWWVSIASHQTIRLRARCLERGSGLSLHATGRWSPVPGGWAWRVKLLVQHPTERGRRIETSSGADACHFPDEAALHAVDRALNGRAMGEANRAALVDICERLRAHLGVTP